MKCADPQPALPDRPDRELLETVLTEVRAIRAEQIAMRAEIAAMRGPAPEDLCELVTLIAQAVKGHEFNARELADHAAADGNEALRDALGGMNTLQIGKLLRRLEAQSFEGLRIERIGIDREGVIWSVVLR